MVVENASDGETANAAPEWLAQWLPLAVILCVAAALRFWHVAHWSLWYDEVVTMRLARAANPASMVSLLSQIDATRAPLHPLVLMAWIRLLGDGDLAARSLSAVLGILTVAAVFFTARSAFGDRAALWSAWLSAVCPTMIYFSQEVRMYALLVLLTVLSWWLFLGFRHAGTWPRAVAYALILAALVYTQPLGLFMVAAHLLAYGLVARSLKLTTGRWLFAMGLTAVLVAPWIGRYLDHAPDYPLPRYPIRFLLAVPIEYIGGNSLTLIPLAALIATGLFTWRDGRPGLREPVEAVVLVSWFVAPITSMYLYSFIGYPIFGPSRYNLFVAPAYLILVARGLAGLPGWTQLVAGALMLSLTASGLSQVTYAPGVKADWRGLARWIDEQPAARVMVVVESHDPLFPRTQFEAARYYLEPDVDVQLGDGAERGKPRRDALPGEVAYHAHCFVSSDTAIPPSEQVVGRFHGLTLTREIQGQDP